MKELITDKDDNYAALIGIDWADKKHDICEFCCGSGDKKHRVIAHTAESIEK